MTPRFAGHINCQNWLCAQLGAREHFAVPRALHREHRLFTLYTDIWAGATMRNLAFGPIRSLAARFHPELANADVRSSNWQSIGRHLTNHAYQRLASREPYGNFIKSGSHFAVTVRETLKRQAHLPADPIFFAYDTGALEAMEWCRSRGIRCVVNQMDPSREEAALVRKEEERWPNWQRAAIRVPEAYFQRREQEWRLADRVVVNSAFCRDAMRRQGVPQEKLIVVPLSYEAPIHEKNVSVDSENEQADVETRMGRPLSILWLGQVILRKGIQYLIEAAKLLEGAPIRFDVVGPLGISQAALASAPRNMIFHGRVARDQASNWYRRADVFALPTLSDGFAITQLEAMTHGLPVVATPCCGDVVSDGEDGFIVPAQDAAALAASFLRFLEEPGLIRHQRNAALNTARRFGVERLAVNLRSLEDSLGTG